MLWTYMFCIFAALMCSVHSFRIMPGACIAAGRFHHSLKMAENNPLDEIKAKMKANPNYNPMTDPQAAAALDLMIPDYLKELPNAMERLSVAFKDATTGADAIGDIDKVAESFENKRELISSPQSEFFRSGMQAPSGGSGDDVAAEIESLVSKLRQQYPEVPFE
jgi:hypothetical protein